MNSIPDSRIAFDTNVYLFAIRQDPNHLDCASLLFEYVSQLKLYVPRMVLMEIRQNLQSFEFDRLIHILVAMKNVELDYSVPPAELVQHYQSLGAKKGDSVISAHLHLAGVPLLVSENRHFLSEIPNLPFSVMTAAECVRSILGAKPTP